MIKSLTLQNFKSFGERVTVPLEPITVLVGPNNSGKSCLLSVSRFMRNLAVGNSRQAVDAEGGDEFFVHRPAQKDGSVLVGWEVDQAKFFGSYLPTSPENPGYQQAVDVTGGIEKQLIAPVNQQAVRAPDGRNYRLEQFVFFRALASMTPPHPLAGCMSQSVLLRLVLQKLQADSPVVEKPEFQADGSGMAAVLGAWRGSQLDLAEELDAFLHRCVREVKHAIVRNAKQPGTQRVWFKQEDGQEFDAPHASDGLLMFTALAMHIIQARPGTTFFIEEPETGIHPRRLREIVEMMRLAVHERGCQFVMATHSTVLLNEMRDTPESIILVRRGPLGTEAKPCTKLDNVVDALQTSSPGELLETAFFEALWGAST